jgi:class 3 adenylate cyclase
MLDRSAEINIVVPCHLDDVLERFNRKAGAHWSRRLHHVIERAARLHFVTEERCLDDAVLDGMCDRITAGLGRMRADVLEVDPVLVALPGRPDHLESPAANEQIERWRRSGKPTVWLDVSGPAGALSSSQEPERESASAATDTPQAVSAYPREIRVMLFADMVGFSRLQEAQLPLFLEEYLQRLAHLLSHTEHRPIARNTWGDGLFLVFDRVETGCRLALELRDLVRSIDWGELGLPENLAIRISLHSGPVFPIFDPVLEVDSFLGSHVSRAARIEPITTPGCVYASEQVAAILKSDENDLECEYVG